jgi:hypothetical protein
MAPPSPVLPVPVVRPRSRIGQAFVALGIFAIIAIMFGGCLASTRAPSTVADIKVTVIDACEKSVTAQLKAPGTAVFSGTEAYTGIDAAHYSAKGFVDSQNSFGAMLRSAWTCDATWDATTKTATGHAVVIDGAS